MSHIASVSVSKKRLVLFLNFLSETGRVDHAAKMAGFNGPTALYRLRKENDEFRQAWEESLDRAGDMLEAEAVRRAVDGVEKPVFYKGEICGHVREYSDGLMGKLLEGAKPDKYNKRTTEHKGSVNVNVGLAVIPMIAPRLEDWERDSLDLHNNIIEQSPQPAQLPAPEAVMSSPVKVIRV